MISNKNKKNKTWQVRVNQEMYDWAVETGKRLTEINGNGDKYSYSDIVRMCAEFISKDKVGEYALDKDRGIIVGRNPATEELYGYEINKIV